MSYRIEVLNRADKSLRKLPRQEFERVRDAIRALGDNPRPVGCKKLVGRDGWRIRVGRYRVIYEIEDSIKIIVVLDVGHRREAYR